MVRLSDLTYNSEICMRIALSGYGKMGKELEKAILDMQHEVVLRISSANAGAINDLAAVKPDVVIEFSTPATAVQNIYKCFESGIPVVVGTTGWYDELDEIKQRCLKGDHSMIYASNFSIGVNILFDINRKLARIMNHRPEYDVIVNEIHHTKKLDAPSGTAITIANGILDEFERKKKWILTSGKEQDDLLAIHSQRNGDVTGIHQVQYTSTADILELRHEARNRSGFVQGALLAASWITQRKGFYTMQDLLNLQDD